MLKRLHWGVSIALLGVAVLLSTVLWRDAQGEKVSEVKFVLGENIVKTAEASGVPRFNARNIDGLVSYSVNNIPRDISVRYAKPGYDITLQPVFGFRMYADKDTHPDLRVDTVDLQLDLRNMTDEQAQAFVESTIAQFQKGKWRRYANPEEDILLTGRSSYLDENGQIEWGANTIDPNYKIPMQDWLVLSGSAIWHWVGDGVLAKLTVNNSPGQDNKPAYRMSLEFELLDVKLKRDAENLARDLKEGDAKGWDSTAQHFADKQKRTAQLRAREANAIRRGDQVLPTPLLD